MSDSIVGWEKVQVGRDGVAVPDPLNDFRFTLPEDWALWLDREATLLSVDVVDASDAKLAQRLRELGAPLKRFDGLDGGVLQEDDSYGGRTLAKEEALASAQAELHVHELERGSDDPVLHELRTIELEFVVDERQSALGPVGDAMDPWCTWSAPEQAAAVEWVATVREQAIRQQLAIRRELGHDAAGGLDESMPLRDIGPSVDVAGLTADKEWETAHMHTPMAWDRERVRTTLTADRLQHLLGDQRTQQLSQRMAPLAEWASELPISWIRERHAELGPADQHLDRGTTRAVARLESAVAAEQAKRNQALADWAKFAASDAERARVASLSADHYLETMKKAKWQLAGLAHDEDHPNRFANSPVAALAAVYHDELEIRRQVWIKSAVDASLANPHLRLQERIGPTPSKDAPHRAEWEAVARELEGRELAYSSAAKEGLEPPGPPNPTEEAHLQHRIDAVREAQGMDLAGQQQLLAIERNGLDMA